MDEATARELFYHANAGNSPIVIQVFWQDIADLTQFWLDHHEVGGQEVWETKQVEEVEASNG
jgi:hypothetical protein